MKELDEMEKVNAKLSAAVEEVTLEHCKKNEVIWVEIFTISSCWWNSFLALEGGFYMVHLRTWCMVPFFMMPSA